MSLETLVASYGYPLLFLGAIFEGETILIIASFLAHRGYLQLHWVLTVALIATIATDQSFFYLGRTRGSAFLQRRTSWQVHVGKVRELLRNHETSMVLGFRFLYGLRTIAPFVIGMSGFSLRRFALLNTIGAVVWVGVVGGAGYAFGQALESMMSNVKEIELWVLTALALVGCVVWAVRRKRFMSQVGDGPK